MLSLVQEAGEEVLQETHVDHLNDCGAARAPQSVGVPTACGGRSSLCSSLGQNGVTFAGL